MVRLRVSPSLRPGASGGPDDRFYWCWAVLLWVALLLLAWLSQGCKRGGASRSSQGPARPAARRPGMAPDALAPPAETARHPGLPVRQTVVAPKRGAAPSIQRGHAPGARRVVASAPPGAPGSRGSGALAPSFPPLPAEVNLAQEVRRLFDTQFCLLRQPDAPCRKLDAAIATYRKQYLAPMRRWLARHRPEGLPATLLYPFSGGDLVSALSAFPDQREYVHLSLEHGGPPDPLRGRSRAQIREAHFRLYFMVGRLLAHGESFSVDLQKQEQAMLPGVLPLLLVGLRVHGAMPTGLAYLELRPDGRLRPYRREELSAASPRARRLYTTWRDPRYSARFSHLELRFRLPGDTADRRLIHLSVNLSNPGLGRQPQVARFVSRLGPVAVMLKAASYLLWTDGFSRVRDLIFAAARFGISDLTAPYPRWLARRGFVVEAHGRYDCMKKPKLRGAAVPWIRLFRKPASRHLPFRWGYVDCRGQNHIVLIRRRAAPANP